MIPPDGVAGPAPGATRGAGRSLPGFWRNGRRAASRLRAALGTRGELFSALVVVGFLNGTAHRAMLAITADPAKAFEDTVGISAVVWIALLICFLLFRQGPSKPVDARDLNVSLAVLLVFATPVSPLSWLALTALGVYVLATSPPGSADARAAAITLGLTVPMFWSKLVFMVLSDVVLRFDAVLVAFIIDTERVGNAVAFRDGWGYFWIAPACSSISNVSLSILCWVLVARGLYPDKKLPARYCAYAAVAVVAVNVLRMSVTGFGLHSYNIVHSEIGNTLSGIFALAAMFAICIHGARRAEYRDQRSADAAHA